jgi:hypothetical protein
LKARNKRLIKLTEKPQGVTKFYGLTKKEVKRIVHEWYICEFLPKGKGVIQDEYGNDLEEIVDIF